MKVYELIQNIRSNQEFGKIQHLCYALSSVWHRLSYTTDPLKQSD